MLFAITMQRNIFFLDFRGKHLDIFKKISSFALNSLKMWGIGIPFGWDMAKRSPIFD